MGMSKKDGGPAFPRYQRQSFSLHGMDRQPSGYGMTLRDYFAGQWLAGDSVGDWSDWNKSDAAKIAYEIADAMLAARESSDE
jgi:hypothetical protein